MASFTARDELVLKTLFDPEAAATSAIRIDKQLPPHPSYTISTFTQIRALESSIIRPLATTDTTRESVQDVIQQLSVLISQHPTLASAYVNRAQARRLLVSPSELFATKDLVDQVLHDLGRAIDFASPSSPTEAVSPYQADVLAASHTHRAVILLKLAELLRHDDDDGTAARGVNASLGDLGADAVEELASRDFALGGKFGNKMALQMSVKTNAYAKMCGAIVKEAMRKEVAEALGYGV